jgi:hypothetical protein
MIYLLAYSFQNDVVLTVNPKGQFVGSTDLKEAIGMLPDYNHYNAEDLQRQKHAPTWQDVFRARIICVPSLENIFTYTSTPYKKNIAHYKEIIPTFKDKINYIHLHQLQK